MAKTRKIVKKKPLQKISKKKVKKQLKKPIAKKVLSSKKQASKKPVEKSVKKQPKRGSSKKKAAIQLKGYDASQLQLFKDLKHKLQEKSNAELKEMLKKNDQTCTGTKDELIEKIADGKVLGKIPRCSNCFGGRLRFDYKSGVYKCPGYRDDTDFHNCQKEFTIEEIKRDTWIE